MACKTAHGGRLQVLQRVSYKRKNRCNFYYNRQCFNYLAKSQEFMGIFKEDTGGSLIALFHCVMHIDNIHI